MIKLVIFDLDGVLADTKTHHFSSLNESLVTHGYPPITLSEHYKIYDGLTTFQKLNILSANGILPTSKHQEIWLTKQKITSQLLENTSNNPNLIELFKYLKDNEIKIYVATNSIEATTRLVLEKLGVLNQVDFILTNKDVRNPKPHPEIYLRCILNSNLKPNEILILEDSPHGICAAQSSGCHVEHIHSISEVNLKSVLSSLAKYQNDTSKPFYSNEKMNVLIPMAGGGKRFLEANYALPKPLIDVKGKPMIHRVVENLSIKAHYIFIIQKEHGNTFGLKYFLNSIAPNCDIIQVDGITEGAACTALLAESIINNHAPLVIANSDQLVDWEPNEFFYHLLQRGADGGILTFNSSHPKWSYVATNESQEVTRVAEKEVISNQATVGIYYWKYGSDFVKYAKEMINKNIRVNGEFYICPVFNQAIRDEKKILSMGAKNMYGLGTPEDLNYYLQDEANLTQG